MKKRGRFKELFVFLLIISWRIFSRILRKRSFLCNLRYARAPFVTVSGCNLLGAYRVEIKKPLELLERLWGA